MSFPLQVMLQDSDVRSSGSTQIHPLGTLGVTRDGRKFRYSLSGAAITIGRLCQTRAPGTWSDDCTFKSTYAAGSTKVVVYVGAASTGAKSSDGTTNYFKDGYMLVNDGTGEGGFGQIYKQGGWSTGSTAGHYSTVSLWDDGLKHNVTSATECGFALNPFKKVVMAPKTQTGGHVGIAPADISSGNYFWLQTGGPAPCKVGGTVVIGNTLVFDAGTNTGYFTDRSSETAATKSSDIGGTGILKPSLGRCLEVGATGETGIIMLNFD